ncbi:bifunctional DNA primase/polymerase [Mycobacterium sp. pV006]|uniref:bifunctional DNA primase/polymerase n=1 Tax=Mycobacterium sp. pV006 TaxID=3238983 RepID=UPI00351ACD4C
MKNTAHSGSREAQLSAVLADVPKADDHDGVREYLHALAALGCAPLLIYPGSKQPADMRSPQRQSADDKAAQQQARDAGKRNWQRVKSDAGVHLATSDVATLDDYLDRYIATFGDAVQINAALSLGRSRLVVVDCDSVQQRAAFLADARGDAHIAQTVSTPGHVGDGDPNDPESWAHSNGGHFWFVVPDDVELPQRPESMSIGDGDDAYSVMWGAGKYALIPPSVRDEGTYTVSGDVHALPDWLRARIIEHGQSHAERAQRSREHIDNDSPIARWGATISWTEILRATDWTPNGKADSCGCETWAAPGPHASAKSATAHEPGCAQWVDSSDPPMHIWTDHDIEPFDALNCATVSRLQAVALIDFDNDMGAAMTALDLHDDSDSLALNDDLGLDIGRRDDDDENGDRAVPKGVTLPASFWEARDSLRHIRDAALARRAAPDATLGAVLARISAHTPPCVRVDTGIMSPLPLHLFAASVSWSGKGKTSAMTTSAQIVRPVPSWSMDPMDDVDRPVLLPGGEPFPRVGKIRSGEGIAEMYWGDVMVTGPKGKPVKERKRVRSNVLMHTDEAHSLVKYITDPKSTVGETLREAWSDQAIGQSNADGSRYRFVPAGAYRLALIVGFHLSVLADLLTAEQILLGTPQRFINLWSKPDPRQVSRELLAQIVDPGTLDVTIPSTGLRLCESLRAKIDDDRIAEWLCDDDVESEPDIRSQRNAMTARVAGLLAILDGRTDIDERGLLVINDDDWTLADVMFETSCAIADLAVTDRRRRQAKAKRDERARSLAESIEDDEARTTPVGRVAARIVGYLTALGPGEHRLSGTNGVLRKFNQADAEHIDDALAQLTAEGKLRLRDASRGAKFAQLIG